MICFFNYSESMGGVEVWSQYFVNLLNNNNINSKILTLKSSISSENNDSLGCKKFSLIAVLKFINYLLKNQYSIIHINSVDIGFWAMPISMILGVKNRYLHFHNAEKYVGSRYIYFKIAELFSTRVFVVSNKISKLNKISHFELIRPLYDIEDRINFEDGISIVEESNFNIVTVGNWREIKNNKLLLELIPKISNLVCWYIIGNGISTHEKLYVNKLIKNGYKIYLIEDCKNPIGFFKKSHLYIGPSRSEGFGLSIVEAQLFGLPLLISNAYPEEALLTNNEIYIIKDINNHDETVSKISELLLNSGKKENFIRNDILEIYNNIRQDDFNKYKNIINNDLSK